ncbi:Epimerase domain-containing protein [Balamuthia mandrillaris]
MSTSVFVAGANGFIGGAVARAFRREGYRVYGLVRNPQKTNDLLKDEILPVIGDMSDANIYKDAIQKCSIIVDCVGGEEFNETLFETVVASSEPPAFAKTYIYTSGLLVYGHSEALLDENSPCRFEADAKRAAFDQRVIGEERVRGIVMRPGFLYGRSGSYSSMFRPPSSLQDQKLVIRGNKNKRWSWIHVDDLCRAYVLAAVHSYKAKGQIFNVVDHSAPTFEELFLAFAKAEGWKGEIEYQAEPGDDFVGLYCEMTCVAHPKKLEDVLGWTPKHVGLIPEVDLYVAALKAHQQGGERA